MMGKLSSLDVGCWRTPIGDAILPLDAIRTW